MRKRMNSAEGAIGELNMVEAWWDRNSAIGAWQYSIPPDAGQATIDWDRFQGRAPKVPFDAMRIFRWRNYQDYGTGVAGDLFVHLFSGMHYVTGAIGPTRVYATGGLRFWNDGRDVPDVMLGLYDYPKTDNHPAFNLALRVNFVNGAGETSGFRFVGSEGIMTIDCGVTVAKQPRESEPGYTIDTFAKATREQFLEQYRKEHPQPPATADAMRPEDEEEYLPPPDTAIIWIITAISGLPFARASRSWKTRCSGSAPRARRCCPTSVTSNTGLSNGIRQA